MINKNYKIKKKLRKYLSICELSSEGSYRNFSGRCIFVAALF